MEEKNYYLVGDKKYAIPKDKSDAFLGKFPDAVEAKYYDNVNGKKYYIPLDKVEQFESKFDVKKKGQTQPQEEVSTSASQTPAQPSGESGAEAKQLPTLEGGVEPYKVNDTAVTKGDLVDALKDEDFVQGVRNGEVSLQITDDLQMEDYVNNIIAPPADKKIEDTTKKIAENDDTVVGILGRAFQAGASDLVADLYRTPEFVYDVAVNGYNKLLEMQDAILPESMESKKIATTQQLSEMTGVDNRFAENLEAYADKKNEINQKYRQPILESIEEGNVGTAALNTAMSISESLPFTLSIMIPSAAGIKAGKMFLGTTGVMASGRKQDLIEEEDVTETQANANALLYGMAEATDVLIGSGSVGRAIGSVVKKGGVNKAKDFTKSVVDKLIEQKTYLAPFAEGFQEAFTTYAQNASDRVTGVDTEKPLTEGVADSFIVGATMGTGSTVALQSAKYIAKKRKGNASIDDLNNVTKNQQVFDEVTGQIDALVNTGEITEEEAVDLKQSVSEDVDANAAIPENIEGKDREKAVELQKEYVKVKANQEQASEAFNDLYKGDLENIKNQLQELAIKKEEKTTEAKEENQDIPQENFDNALEIIEPITSERGELTVEQLGKVMDALGENSSDIVDISKKQDAVDLYNLISDKKEEYAKEQQGGEVREQTVQETEQEVSDTDMPSVNETELQDGEQQDVTQTKNNLKKVDEDIFTPTGNKVKDFLGRFRRKYLSAKKFLPRSVFKFKEDTEASVAKQMNIMQANVADFNRATKKIKDDKERNEVISNFDKYIRGENVELPDNLKKIGNEMRNQIDALSLDLINNGLVEAHKSETIKENLGKYMTRSYEVFDKENWKEKVQEEVVQKARNFLKGQLQKSAEAYKERTGDSKSVDEILDIMVSQQIEEILNKEGASNFITGSKKIGSKDVSVLRQRKDIPFEIRALMGEYTDPIQNYARTIQKMSALVANAKFLNQTRELGLGNFLWEKNDINRPPETVQIASEGSETMNPLNGLYASKEMVESLEEQREMLADWVQIYMKLISTVKWAKTIASVATHAKNIFGNIGFMMVNGHYRISELNTAYKVAKNDFMKSSNKELRDRMNKYIELGIVKQSAGVGEIKDMFKDANFDDAMAERLSNKKLNAYENIKRKGLRGKKVIEDLYQAEDDFFKIVAYENEASRYSKALFGKDKSELNDSERKQLDDKIAEIVKNTYPTYSRVPEAIQMIRRFPAVGNFVSFQAEAWRTAANTLMIAKEEIKSKNPEVVKIGAQRMVGVASYEILKDAIVGYFGMAAGTGLSGMLGMMFNSEDEDEKDTDVRRFVAPWSKASDLWILEASDGNLRYIDYSASDPHGGIRQVFNAFAEGKDLSDSFVNGLYQTIEPFVGEEIATKAARNILSNQNNYGGKIYNPEDTREEQTKDILAYVYKTVELGTTKTLRGIYNAENKGQELVASFMGLRVYDVDLKKQMGYKVLDYKDRIREARSIYNKAFYSKKSTPEDIQEAYNRSSQRINEILGELREDYNSANRLGVSSDELYTIMKDKKLTQDQINSVEFGDEYFLKEKYKD